MVIPVVFFHFLNRMFLVSGISNNTSACIQLRDNNHISLLPTDADFIFFFKKGKTKS